MAIPAWYAELLTRIVPRRLLPFGLDQVQMSQEENTCDPAKFAAAFGWTPRPFGETLRAYARRSPIKPPMSSAVRRPRR